MGKTRVEGRGRVLIPKDIREKLGIRGGEAVRIEERDGEVVVRPLKSPQEIRELKGCVKDSDIDPLELKKVWEM